MDLGKISEERLFLNNSKTEITHWCKNLKYFHYMRARAGHNCEGDSFCAYFRYGDQETLTLRLGQLGIVLKELEPGCIAYDPFEDYSFEDLERIRVTTPRYPNLEQPQYVTALGHRVHVWIMGYSFEVSVSGSKDGKTYTVTDNDFQVCCELEKEFDKLKWSSLLDNDIKSQPHCISEEMYPELFE